MVLNVSIPALGAMPQLQPQYGGFLSFHILYVNPKLRYITINIWLSVETVPAGTLTATVGDE